MKIFYSIMIGLAVGMLIFSIPTLLDLMFTKQDIQTRYATFALAHNSHNVTTGELYVSKPSPEGIILSGSNTQYDRTFTTPENFGFYRVNLVDIEVPSIANFHENLWPVFREQPTVLHICTANIENIDILISEIIDNNMTGFKSKCQCIAIVFLLQISLSLLLLSLALAGYKEVNICNTKHFG